MSFVPLLILSYLLAFLDLSLPVICGYSAVENVCASVGGSGLYLIIALSQ